MTGVLAGKVAVVTGANSGIGLAIARRFAEEGARVFLTGRRQEPLDAAVAEIGPAATGVRADVSVQADLDHLYSVVREEAGRIDVLVANAGSAVPQRLGEITEEAIDATFGTNVKGTIFTVQKALPLLRAPASVVLIGSVAGSTGVQGCTVYGASKAAIRSFARTWALELAASDVRVNVIAPGITSTPLVDRITSQPDGAGHLDGLIMARTAMRRLGRAEEIAAAALFLCSAESSFITGAELAVDGGFVQI